MKKLRIGSIDTPSLDYVVPTWNTIEKALAHDAEKLAAANELYDNILDAVGREHSAGDKYTITQDRAEASRELALKMGDILREVGIEVICPGGTGSNKLFNSKAILGDKVETVLFGSVGQDSAGEFISNKMANDGVVLDNNGEHLAHTREAVFITPRDSDNRMIAKFPYKEPGFYHDVELLIEKAKECDYLYLESSLIKFLGPKDFDKFVNAIADEGVKIIFAPPTDKAFYLNDDGHLNLQNLRSFINAEQKAWLTTMNEVEATWLTHDRRFEGKITNIKDEHIEYAKYDIQRKMPEIEGEKIALITAGKLPMTIITKHSAFTSDVRKPDAIVSTGGAGDGAAATFTCTLIDSEEKKISEETLRKAAINAANVSAAIITQPSAQIDSEMIREAMKGNIPTVGHVDHVVATTLEKTLEL